MNAQSKPLCMVSNLLACTAALLVLSGSPALAQDTGTLDKGKVVEQPQPYSPYADQQFPQRFLFGDMHHQSSLSVDSGLIGNKGDPDVSLRLARSAREPRRNVALFDFGILSSVLQGLVIVPQSFYYPNEHAQLWADVPFILAMADVLWIWPSSRICE